MEHQGGHLPFETELSQTLVHFDKPNLITVAVNNTLTADTVPQGFLTYKTGEQYPPNHFIMTDNFDFFKYAGRAKCETTMKIFQSTLLSIKYSIISLPGIHRSVLLYTTPKSHIDDITVTTGVAGTTGSVTYQIDSITEGSSASVNVILCNKEGDAVAENSGNSGVLEVPDVNLWWPYTMVRNVSDAGYLYTLEVCQWKQKTETLLIYDSL